jgi:hypothetical protein
MEIGAVLQGFRDRAKAEAARVKKATESEYWFCVCFQSQEQAEEFLTKSGWASPSQKYLDGQKVARKVGIELTPEKIPWSKPRPVSPRLATLAMEVIPEDEEST